MISCIKAELAIAEIDASKIGIWRDLSAIADAKSKSHIMKAQTFQNAIDVIDKIRKSDYKFKQLTITT